MGGGGGGGEGEEEEEREEGCGEDYVESESWLLLRDVCSVLHFFFLSRRRVCRNVWSRGKVTKACNGHSRIRHDE